MNTRIYYRFINTPEDNYWLWEDWSKLRWAWNPKFIVKQLIKDYWKIEWIEIYNKFMESINRATKEQREDNWTNDAATLVCYRKNNVYKWYKSKE